MSMITRTLLAAAIIGSGASALAADTGYVNVPFSFECKGHEFPAGRYAVQLMDNHNIVHLYSVDHPGANLTWVVEADNPMPGAQTATLKFDREGSEASLATIKIDGYVTARLDKEKIQMRLASNQSSSAHGR